MSESINLHHSIDAKHAQNIGEQSVSDRVQAVIEIVKNSYDADALNCTVHFFASSGGSSTLVHIDKIVIADNGIGMTLDDIKNKWMRLATVSKDSQNISPKFGRAVSGQKGMGHFATQRLGSKIVITSNPEKYKGREDSDDYEKTFQLTTDWDMYEPGKSFDEIPNRLTVVSRNEELNKKLHAYSHGVTIEITNLKEDWTKGDVEKVQLHLGALQMPKFLRGTEKNPFNPTVEAHGFDITGTDEKDISDYAPWTLKAHLRGDKINYEILELNYKTLEKSKAKDVCETVKPSGTVTAGRKHGNSSGDSDIYVYHYPGRGAEYKGERALLEGKGGWIPKQIVRERVHLDTLQRSNAGIKIFKDNIRIRPYGDPRNPNDLGEPVHAHHDWLGLEERKAKRMGDHIRNTRVIGHVVLSRDKNPDIKETTTRQALVENTAFKSLREDFGIQAISVLEEYLKERKIQVKSTMKKAHPTEQASSEIKQLEEFLNDLSLGDQERAEYQRRINEIKKYNQAAQQTFKEEEEKLTSTIEMYRNLSSLGISALAFHHEIMQPLARIQGRVEMLQEKWNDTEWTDDKKLDYLSKTIGDIETVINLNDYIKQFASLFAGTKGARRKREKINLVETMQGLKAGFHRLLRKDGITFTPVRGTGSLDDIWLNRASFESVILNLVGNSINSLQRVARKEKYIKIMVEAKYGHLEIIVSDNGFGILEQNWNRIFEPHWTEKKFGTGMGLTIVKEIIAEDWDGTIEIIQPTVCEEDKRGGGQATFRISIPLKSLEKEEG